MDLHLGSRVLGWRGVCCAVLLPSLSSLEREIEKGCDESK